ncbi:hypothetical protein [Agitococcus lubricus]|uniref:Uncharacterized protein n=1 Tax=Agitococcus lubricus TaxID=1077255 RepID=A0A2T5J426_9GAMM|nr:hypothetical protein [Agitococcus lubricus]PTQ91306.1 hypothetical protein C8N29_101379 [Agitococcus lubricus]
MKTYLRQLFMLALAVLPVYVWAWSKEYQSAYILGDSDSRISAKQQALSQVQLQAMQEAGTYIQGQTQLVNDKLDERIAQIKAAIVKVQVLNERFELTATGQQKLSLSVRAHVDESVLQARIKALQQESQPTQQPALLSTLQQQQQKLMLDNQLLRRQLEALSQQTPLQPTSEPQDLVSWLMNLNAQWQQKTSMMPKRLSSSELTAPTWLVDWHLSMNPDSPLAQLCQRWQCLLAYAYKYGMNDGLMTPLHQQLFRPFSRMVHIDDKYISHWQIITLQAYPPQPLTASEQAFIEGFQVHIQTKIGQQTLSIPIVSYDTAQGALVIRVQGLANSEALAVYDAKSRQGNLACALKQPKQCSAPLFQPSLNSVLSQPIVQH